MSESKGTTTLLVDDSVIETVKEEMQRFTRRLTRLIETSAVDATGKKREVQKDTATAVRRSSVDLAHELKNLRDQLLKK